MLTSTTKLFEMSGSQTNLIQVDVDDLIRLIVYHVNQHEIASKCIANVENCLRNTRLLV